MELYEQHYQATRGESADNYQTLDVIKEYSSNRNYIKFTLMEQRWRDAKEAAAYLRWAASELEKL